MRILRTQSNNEDFKSLVTLLDKDLAVSDGEEYAFYNQFNGLDDIKHAVVLYVDEEPVACGAIKNFDEQTMEVKRMYTKNAFRGKRLGQRILEALEDWAKELGYQRCVMETGLRQPSAIRLYERSGYERIPNYGQYAGKSNSVCFEKGL